MAVLNATTLDDVKNLLSLALAETKHDADLNDLIAAVSKRAEGYIGRPFNRTERTETYDVKRNTRSVFLRAWPVDTGQTFEVKNHSLRDFASVDAMDATLYDIDPTTGRLKFDSFLFIGSNTLQVRYTGGLAADASALQAIEDLEYAIRRQVAHEHNRRSSPGGKDAVKGRGRSVTAGRAQGQVNWLDSVRDVLDAYRADHFGVLR